MHRVDFSFRNSLAASIFLHAFAICAIWLASQAQWISRTETPSSRLRVDYIDTDSFIERQIVESAATPAEKTAPRSRLSDKNRITERETTAKNPGQPKAASSAIPLKALGISVLPNSPGNQAVPKALWAQNTDPSELAAGGTYVEGVKESEATALNTKEYVFYSYFQRVRKQLDQAWYPILRAHLERFLRKGRALASDMAHRTRTLVTLDTQGEVVQVQILDSSGTFDLDEAAIDAFNKAGPFPNPPQGLRDSEGKVQIRWDFVLRT